MFNLMDIIVIDGDPTILPWSLSAIKVRDNNEKYIY
jgi:hypothetical protein